MDRVQLVMLGLPLLLFFTDLLNLFTPPPPRPHLNHNNYKHNHHQHKKISSPLIQQSPDFPSQKIHEPIGNEGVGFGSTIDISFCSSCSYKGTAVTMKKMLETSFPGIDVNLSNHPPALPKRLLGKLVPVAQIGVIAIVMAGEQIFPRLGFMTPPAWYFSLRANRFGAIASTWLLGNVMQNFLQSSGAFEVYFNGDLVFSKLKEHRFPSEFELRDLITKKLASARIVDGLGSGSGLWS